MNFKRFSTSDNQWHDVPYYIHNTSTDTLTTPADIYANDTTVTVGLKGDMSQTGTPTPTNPIQPQECGEITANMLNAYKENYSINEKGVETPNDVAMIYKANVVVSGSTFTLTFGGLSIGDTVRIHAYTGDTWKGQIARIVITQVPFAFTAASGVDNIRISIRKTATDVTMTDGQYKIPILNNSQTTNVYLGEVQSTRRIKKLVLKGSVDENITLYTVATGNLYRIELPALRILGQFDGNGICTHYRPVAKAADRVNGTISGGNSAAVQGFVDIVDDYESVDAFKAYLAQQYAAGTPVTVWYVLATEETAVVNEPLMKIGDYADEIINISIPTIVGTNTFDVDTTVQPSEVTLHYHGWHPINNVHEHDNGEWN